MDSEIKTNTHTFIVHSKRMLFFTQYENYFKLHLHSSIDFQMMYFGFQLILLPAQ